MAYRILIFLGLCSALAAQQGDRKGHQNTRPVVPEDVIPAAPVLSVGEALETFQLQPGFVIEPVAAEPLVDKPVALDFDERGRMWVCEMRGYMPDIDGKGEADALGRIVVLEDSDGDGTADTRSLFLDGLLLPRAVCVFQDGLLFIDERRLCWIERDGTSPVGEVEVIDAEFARGGNVEHKPNGLLPNLDNWLYLAKCARRVRRGDGSWVIEDTSFRGQWGIARDDWGRLYHNSNSTLLVGDQIAPNLLNGNPAAKMRLRESTRLGSNRVWPARVTPAMNRAYIAKANGYGHNTLDPETHKLINASAAAGMTVYRGTNFPSAWQNVAFIGESATALVKAIRIEDEHGKLSGTHVGDRREFLSSTDERFRPVNAYNAPDGSLYVVDMYHGIIQHKTYMTSYLREQILSRGLDEPAMGHGRIYRIRHQAGALQDIPDFGRLSAAELVATLGHPNAWHREMAQRLIVQGRAEDYAEDLRVLVGKPSEPRACLHALWCLEGLGILVAEDLIPAIRSDHPKLQNGGLWAASTLSPTAQAAIAARFDGSEFDVETLPYLARVLAGANTTDGRARLAELLESHGDVSCLREAAVSGLAGQEREFLRAHQDRLGDSKLSGWLEKAAADSGRSDSGPGLEGKALASFERGRTLYHGEAACIGCHGADGAGLDNLGPPLDGSEWVTGDAGRLVKILLHGMTGPVEVAGETYAPPAAMPGMSFNPAMTDQRLADLATYIRHEWENQATVVEPTQVGKVRAATEERAGRPWTAEDFH